jgi:four helix bundle protein
VTSDELKERTMGFALRVVKMVEALPENEVGRTVARQMVRCATSVAANYRAALRAKSDADFINKVTIVLEEADEVGFWLEFSARAQLLSESRLKGLIAEADELTRIFNATRTSTRKRLNQGK